MKHRLRVRGFTLLEITVVLFILGLLIASLFGPLETQLEARDRRQTEDALERIVEALGGFAITERRLPCPDADGDGRADPVFDPADPASAACTVTVGLLPWSDLGVAPADAWGNLFTYAVTNPTYTRPESDGLCNGNDAPAHFDLCSTGTLTVQGRGDNPATAESEGKFLLATYATGLPAVVISHGRNGFGARSATGVILPAPAGGDERENADGDTVFMARGYARDVAGCSDDANESTPLCEYDDLVAWLAPSILNGRMVSAGRLP